MDIGGFVGTLDAEQKRDFANRTGTTVKYLIQLAAGHRRTGQKLAKRFVKESRKMFPDDSSRWLTLAGIRPDIWGEDAAA